MSCNTKFFSILIINSFLVGTFACTNESHDNDNETPAEIAKEHNEAKFDGEEENKADYLVHIAAANLSIIKISEIAEQQTTNDKVKKFATNMVDEHKKISKEIYSLASAKSITIPEDMAYSEADGYKNISKESGANFDIDYIDQLTNQQQDFINKMDTTNADYKDMAVKKFMNEMLPKIRQHIDKAITLKKSLEEIKK